MLQKHTKKGGSRRIQKLHSNYLQLFWFTLYSHNMILATSPYQAKWFKINPPTMHLCTTTTPHHLTILPVPLCLQCQKKTEIPGHASSIISHLLSFLVRFFCRSLELRISTSAIFLQLEHFFYGFFGGKEDSENIP